MKNCFFMRPVVGILFLIVCGLAPLPVSGSDATVEMHRNFPNLENCSACHADPHNGQMRFNCGTCHNTDRWDDISSSFTHPGEFPLTGNHKQVSCNECHRDGQYKGTPRDCQVCHWQRRRDDPYETRLGIDCARCHSPRGWTPANWNHTVETGFKLSGAHRGIACDECHKDLNFESTRAQCIACHENDYNGTRDPDHRAGGFPKDCQICHDTSAWSNSSYNHDTTGFPLTGGHAGLDCSACHTDGVYTGLSTECLACHEADYNGTRDPNHRAAGFATDCIQCHDVNTWTSGTFDHDTTGYSLTGAHQTVSCSECHTGGTYAGTSQECAACHADDYAATTDPNHTAAGYGTDCAACHDTGAWQSGTFTHTGFDLSGAHAGLDCTACHTNGQYAGTPRECAGCHRDDYDTTGDPHHAAAGFSTDCATCHDASTWTSGRFDHNTTGYPLTGKHSGLNCSECHGQGVYSGLNTACYSCHEDDYTGAVDPNHIAAGFSSDCTLCHDTSGWTNDFFNHSTTGYTLTGAHTSLDCRACHTNGQYAGTSRECFSCHEDDYRDAPNHGGYPTDCEQCHTTFSWSDTRLQKPIRSGPLRRKR